MIGNILERIRHSKFYRIVFAIVLAVISGIVVTHFNLENTWWVLIPLIPMAYITIMIIIPIIYAWIINPYRTWKRKRNS